MNAAREFIRRAIADGWCVTVGPDGTPDYEGCDLDTAWTACLAYEQVCVLFKKDKRSIDSVLLIAEPANDFGA